MPSAMYSSRDGACMVSYGVMAIYLSLAMVVFCWLRAVICNPSQEQQVTFAAVTSYKSHLSRLSAE